MNVKDILILATACIGIAACNNQHENKTANVAATTHGPASPHLPEPFKYHKLIEVSPGNYYDVLSWGRGAKGGGAFAILRSDSSDQQYDALNGDLEGPIQDVLNSDLDIDGNPEIIIAAKSIDTNRYANVFAYEYHDKQAQKLDFPRMTNSQRKGYHGNDSFYIKDSKLIREFPVYEGSGNEAKPTGEKRLLEYSLHGSGFSVKQLSSDSAIVNKETAANVAPPDGVINKPAKIQQPEKQESKKEASKSHRSERSHSRERHSRRHHTEERHRSSERHHRSEIKKKRRHRR